MLPPRMSAKKRKVVVIGGGLAGMTAAYELAKQGYAPLLLERGGHFGGKVMSSVGYGGMPIEHGVHGWWKGYGNFDDVLRELHGEDWQRELFTGPYYSRFVARTADGRVVSMNRAPPLEGEPRVEPFAQALLAMVKERVLSWADLASVIRFVAIAIGFEHVRDYDRWKGVTAGGVADECGVSKRAQAYILANFSLASAFSPLDRISAAAFFSSLGFYVFDAQASLAGRWLRTHPDELVHRPLCAAIEAHGGEVSPYAQVLGLARSRPGGRVDRVFVDRGFAGLIDARDLGPEPRDLLAGEWPHTPRSQLALARATLHQFDHVWLATARQGDEQGVRRAPLAWTGESAPPAQVPDARWLEVEWSDEALSRFRVLEDRYETMGTIAAADVPAGAFRELLWAGRAGEPLHTPPHELARLRDNLARYAYLFPMHVADQATPPHLPLYVGEIKGERCGFAGICTHFGGRLRWDASLHSFACQLHGSRFAGDGQRTCGPAEADLFPFRLLPDAADPARLHVQVRLPPRIHADHVVLATDVSGVRRIVQSSPTLQDAPAAAGLLRLRTTSITVVRFPIGRRIDDTLALFDGFDTLDALFNVTKLQGVKLDRYRDREHEVIELQIYGERYAGQLSREALLGAIRADLKAAYGWDHEPEILEPVHVAVHRDVYTSYDPESEAYRPRTTAPGLPGLAFAGDWVQPDDGAWYMERAVRTGRLAAREVVRDAGGDPARVPLVPPVREPWNLRTLLAEAEGGTDRAMDLLKEMFGYHDEP
jgi:nitrite reductase/ring-hydroxylating ferredoxin subunit